MTDKSDVPKARDSHFGRRDLLGIVISFLVLVGCGGQSPYPETVVRSPMGREGVCFACQKKIESVSQSNLITIGAVQFIVCDEKCAAQTKTNANNDPHDH
ncbi:MAG: hypothetical protein NT013_30795 [Planctomycetia bacterium]|nr:hypothetical protein [Planctomycetia bacterium]